jgi:folate-binding protein YgfZ
MSKNHLFDLTTQSLLEFTGEDAKTFLQGQLTNDINDVTDETSQLSGYCNPKGRLLALFHIFSIQKKLYLQFPKVLLAKIQKRLQMFVMMSNVKIKDCSDELASMGVSGDEINSLLSDFFTQLPNNDGQVITKNNLTIINLAHSQSSQQTRYQIVGSKQSIKELRDKLITSGVELSTSELWTQLDIQAGIPSITEKTYERFVPQMINLDSIGGVNFKKGCYTGQEIVARLHYLGKPKRLMYKIEFEAVSDDIDISEGSLLYSPDSKSSQGAGNIVSLANTAENKFSALAVIEIALIEKKSIYIDEACTIKAIITDLTYNAIKK